ncbi:MAG TPA: hypothetical protein VN253_05850, partial [Kofleriaceae bacterium]|nr:hypothetical protein [Kofleriaceae bacterium]
MRAFHRSVLLVVGLVLVAAPAIAQPKKGDKAGHKKPDKKPDKGAPKAGGGDEIEMDPEPDKGSGQTDSG